MEKYNLHIITCLYRFDNLEKIYASILNNNDIIWHISKSSYREDLNFDFIKKNNNIVLYNVDCDDSDTTSKRNAVLENIKNGYFCFLDDDTVFHENMYITYLSLVETQFRGMLVGGQLNKHNQARLKPSIPICCKIDTGNVLSYYSCLESCRWPKEFKRGVLERDYVFWKSVYDYYGEKCFLKDTPISYYNALNEIFD